jgi:hypothetical protein
MIKYACGAWLEKTGTDECSLIGCKTDKDYSFFSMPDGYRDKCPICGEKRIRKIKVTCNDLDGSFTRTFTSVEKASEYCREMVGENPCSGWNGFVGDYGNSLTFTDATIKEIFPKYNP